MLLERTLVLTASGMGLLLHLGELRDMFPGHIAVAAVLDGAFILGDLPNRFGDESIGPAFKAVFFDSYMYSKVFITSKQ